MNKVIVKIQFQDRKMAKVCKIMRDCDLPSELYEEDIIKFSTPTTVDQAYIDNMKASIKKDMEADGFKIKKIEIKKIYENN